MRQTLRGFTLVELSVHTENGSTGFLRNHNSPHSYFDDYSPNAGADPKEFHAALGGNVGRADGSAGWVEIGRMELRYAGSGRNASPGAPNYNPGYW